MLVFNATRATPWLYMLVAATVVPAAAGQTFEGPASRSFEVRSNPPGAEVRTISGAHGKTPASINERDVYPNTYPSDKQDLYGVVILKRPGCKKEAVRLGAADVRQGLSVDLDCESVGVAAAGRRSEPPASTSGETEVPAEPESMPDRRLRQLRVLQELHDEGLLTGEEEARIRRRILKRQ